MIGSASYVERSAMAKGQALKPGIKDFDSADRLFRDHAGATHLKRQKSARKNPRPFWQ
jgi:hypothetical protein